MTSATVKVLGVPDAFHAMLAVALEVQHSGA